MGTGALQSIIFACVFVCEQLCMCALFVFNSGMFVFFFCVLSFPFVRVSVFLARVCALCLCPCLAPFHKHLVDSVIFSTVFTSPTRHLGVLLVNSLARTCASAHVYQKPHKHCRHIKGDIMAGHKQSNSNL